MELHYYQKKPISKILDLAAACQDECNFSNFTGNGILFHGDNFMAMSMLLKQYRDKIDLVYIDPPYNTGSNFYYDPERTAHVSSGHNAVLAYSDNFSLEEYLEFIRARLVLIHALLSEKGTLYLHCDVRHGAYLRVLLDEIFGIDNFLNEIARVKSNPKNFARKAYGNEKDIILVYAKKAGKHIYNNVRAPYEESELKERFNKVDGMGRYYTTVPCHAPGETKNGPTGQSWKNLLPPPGRHWRCAPDELTQLDRQGLIEWSENGVPRIKKFASDNTGKKIQDIWRAFKDPQYPVYPTEKNIQMLELIIKQSSNKNSLVMDCFCGSGNFLTAGLNNARKVIGVDQSPVAINVIKKCKYLQNLPVYSI